MIDGTLGPPLAAHHGEVGDSFRGTQRLVGAGVQLGHDGMAERMFFEGQGHDGDDPCCDVQF
jgi:hypothetical protein